MNLLYLMLTKDYLICMNLLVSQLSSLQAHPARKVVVEVERLMSQLLNQRSLDKRRNQRSLDKQENQQYLGKRGSQRSLDKLRNQRSLGKLENQQYLSTEPQQSLLYLAITEK